MIGIPESPPPYRNVSGCFKAEFDNLFTRDFNPPGSAPAQVTGDKDWTDVTLPSRTCGQANTAAPTTIPSLNELPRPEILFADQTPYHLILRIVHDGIVVQGSHQASLELLAGYLQKYTRDLDNVSVKVSHALGTHKHFTPLLGQKNDSICSGMGLPLHRFQSSNRSFTPRT